MVNQRKPLKPKVTPEEKKFRENLFPEIKEIKSKNFLCTSCGRSVRELIGKGKPICHPFMETLLCEKCNTFYGDGQFSEDEDGCDKYCRWCGQGGTLFLCSKCTAGFCKKCVKRNLPRSALQELENDDWECYCCNTKPLFELRAQCWAAQQYVSDYVTSKSSKSKSRDSKSISSKKRKNVDSSSDEGENERSSKRRKSEVTDILDDANEEPAKSSSRSGRRDKPSVSRKSSDNGEEEESKKKHDDEGGRSRRQRKDEAKKQEEKSKRKSSVEETSKKKNSIVDNEMISGVRKTHWNQIIKRCNDVTSDIAKVTKDMHKFILEIKVKRINLKRINSFESLAEARKRINESLDKLSETSLKIKDSFHDYCEEWLKEANASPEQEEKNEDVPSESIIPKESLENGISNDLEADKMDVDDEGSKASEKITSTEENKSSDIEEPESKIGSTKLETSPEDAVPPSGEDPPKESSVKENGSGDLNETPEEETHTDSLKNDTSEKTSVESEKPENTTGENLDETAPCSEPMEKASPVQESSTPTDTPDANES